MMLWLTAIALVFGLTFFAVILAMVLRAIFADSPRRCMRGVRILETLNCLSDLARLADFDPPN